MDAITDHFRRWRITINPEKTQYIVFTKRQIQRGTSIVINGTAVADTSPATYLGLTMDRGLAFTQHINSTGTKCFGALAALQRLVNQNSPLPQNIKMHLHNVCIVPTLLYAAPIWSFVSSRNYDRLEVCQMRSLRRIKYFPPGTTNQYIRSRLRVPSIKDIVFKRTNNFVRYSLKKSKLTKDIPLFLQDTTYKKRHKYISDVLRQ